MHGFAMRKRQFSASDDSLSFLAVLLSERSPLLAEDEGCALEDSRHIVLVSS